MKPEIRTFVTLGGDEITVALGPSKRRRGPGPKRDDDGPSRDQRRTKRNAELIAIGVHPATRQPTIDGETCERCVHRHTLEHNGRRYHKCALHRLGMSSSAESDIRLSWPACTKFDDGTD